MEFRVEQENPLRPAIRELIGELNAHLLTLTPAEHCSHMTAEQMADASTTVFLARTPDGHALGMGALRREGGGIAEIKRMYTRPEARGQHVGSAILDQIIDLAEHEGLGRLVLETGDRHPEAWRLYESRGFTRCGPVLDYPDSPWSVFYEKSLAESTAA
ncbi:MAG: GNAT family N-acetyltransferase [Devosia sp.]